MANLIAARIQDALNQHHLPGLAVAVNHRGDQVFAGGCGHFDPAGRRMVSEHTVYGVASLSKLVTTMLILLLQERGDLSVDDLLVRHFPRLNIAHSAPIRLAHLLSHSAGFPGLPGRFHARNIDNVNDQSGGVDSAGDAALASHLTGAHEPAPESATEPVTILSAGELVDLINRLDVQLLAPPGELLNYSNESFCLLGGIIEQITQQPFASAARELVFTPLNMEHSVMGEFGLPAPKEVALPLLINGAGGRDGYQQGKFWQAPLFYPAGGVVSSASDIARLIGALSDKSGLLTAASRQQMMQPQMAVASRPDPRIGYGFGLEFHQIDKETTLLWHSGQRAGISSFLGWLVEEQMAVSVLCNVADAPVAAIAHDLIGKVLNRGDIVWPPATLTRTDATAPADWLGGCYVSDEGNHYVVEQIDNDWTLTGKSATKPIRFRFANPDSGTVGDQTFRFLGTGKTARSDHQRAPWALALDLRVLRRTSDQRAGAQLICESSG